MNDYAQRLNEQGYALLSGLVDKEWIDKLKQEELRFRGNQAHSLSVQLQLVHRSAVIREFVSSGPHLPQVVELLGPNVCFTHQQYVTKLPDENTRTDVYWHQDNGYGQLEPPKDLTVWITLDDCDTGNGCLWVVPESHRMGLLPHGPKRGLMATDYDGDGIPVPMKAGDALVFSSLLLHRSLPNKTNQSRVAMYVRYCEPEVIMVMEGDKPVLEDGYSWMVAGEAK